MYTCIAASHGKVMTQLNPLRSVWRKLGTQFCIPDHDMDAIDANNRGDPWGCLNATVAQWLKWNFTANVKDKVEPNVDWLIRAVKEIDPELAKQLEKGRPCNMLLVMIIILLCIVYKVKISGQRHTCRPQGQLIHIKINTYKHCIIHYYG